MAWKTFVFVLVLFSISGIAKCNVECEDLSIEDCAFSVSSSGARCVLKQTGHKLECQTSMIMAERKLEWIEDNECVKACGVDRKAVGMTADALLDNWFTQKLCSPSCQINCHNIFDLYVKLAAGEGLYLPSICEAKTINTNRKMKVDPTPLIKPPKVENASDLTSTPPAQEPAAQLAPPAQAPAPELAAAAPELAAPPPAPAPSEAVSPKPSEALSPEEQEASSPAIAEAPEYNDEYDKEAAAPGEVYTAAEAPEYYPAEPEYGESPEYAHEYAASPEEGPEYGYATSPEYEYAPSPEYSSAPSPESLYLAAGGPNAEAPDSEYLTGGTPLAPAAAPPNESEYLDAAGPTVAETPESDYLAAAPSQGTVQAPESASAPELAPESPSPSPGEEVEQAAWTPSPTSLEA